MKNWKLKSLVIAAMAMMVPTAANAMLVEVGLTAEAGQSSPSFFSGNLANTLNDGFAYDVNNPTSPAPNRSYAGSRGYHAFVPNNGDALLVYSTTGGELTVGSQFVLDLYGRNSFGNRDNDIDIQLFSGGTGGTLVAQLNGLAIAGNPQHVRADFASELGKNSTFDTIQIIGHGIGDGPQGQNTFTLMEIRAAGDAPIIPEPATATLALFGIGGLVMRRRRVA